MSLGEPNVKRALDWILDRLTTTLTPSEAS